MLYISDSTINDMALCNFRSRWPGDCKSGTHDSDWWPFAIAQDLLGM